MAELIATGATNDADRTIFDRALRSEGGATGLMSHAPCDAELNAESE